MEYEEHEEADEEMETTPSEPPGYDASSGVPVPVPGGSRNNNNNNNNKFRYRECQKNHAVGIGGHAVDGCCEFMAAGEDGSLESLKCAACGCHRNFHRKESLSISPFHLLPPHQQQQPPPSYFRSPPPHPPSGYLHVRPLALPDAAAAAEDHVSNPSSSGGGFGGGGGGGGGSSGSKKRFRTKFSQEQKEKMLEFAERVGWRIQKHDESAVDHFCADTGVRRQVLKVWMHNNKHTLGKKP